MRKRYVCRLIDGEYKMVEGQSAPRSADAPYVIGDIEPYRSLETGEIIGSRSTHRAHLKQHGLIEVGNERLPPRKPVPMPELMPDLVPVLREFNRRFRKR